MRTCFALAALVATAGLTACGNDVTAPRNLDDDHASPLFAQARGSVRVTTAADAGAGSFRAAISAANADASIRSIRFDKGIGSITITAPLVYTGSQPLVIDGRGATVDASGVGDAFTSSGGASLAFHDLTIRNAGQDGIFVPIPASATGEIAVELHGVTLEGHGEYGLHIDDQTHGSAASIRLTLIDSRILNTGFAPGIDDRDGIRVDEGGDGGIIARIERSTITGNAADGIEFDETGDGDVRVVVRHSTFDANGTQPQLPSDLEDGFDIDEAGAGSIVADFLHVSTSRNLDGGIDLDEEGAGDIVVWLNKVIAIDNLDDNIKASEDADAEGTPDPADGLGGILFRLQNVTSTGSSDNGIQLEEFGNGDVNGEIVRSVSSDNGDDGVNIDQQDAGGGTVRLQASRFEGNADQNVNIDGVAVVQVP